MYTETLTFMLKPKEKAALEALAEEESASQAAVLRRLIRQLAKRRGVWPSSDGKPVGVNAEPWWQSKQDRYCAHCRRLVGYREIVHCEQCHDLVCRKCAAIGSDGGFYCLPCAGLE